MRNILLIALAIQYSGIALAATSPDDTIEKKSAEPKWYQADLIVFRYTELTSRESWPDIKDHPLSANSKELKKITKAIVEPILPIPENTNSNIADDHSFVARLDSKMPVIDTPDPARDAFVALPASSYILSKEARILNQSSQYEVLIQTAWRMPVESNKIAQPVRIRASSYSDVPYLLDGTVAVSSSRYLHLDANLWYNALSSEALHSELPTDDQINLGIQNHDTYSDKNADSLIRLESQSPPLRITKNFQLDQRRRIRKTGEVQYLDSPVIGMLFKLTPYDRPDKVILPQPELPNNSSTSSSPSQSYPLDKTSDTEILE